MDIPKVGSIWDHKNGSTYTVLMIYNRKSDRQDEYPVTVIYERLSDGTVWSRPLSRWYGSFTEIK